MKKVLFIVTLISLTHLVSGQSKNELGVTFDFTISDNYKYISQKLNIGSDDKHYYSVVLEFNQAVHNVPPKIFVAKRDEDFNLLAAQKILLKAKDYKLKFTDLESFQLIGDQLVGLILKDNKASKTKELHLLRIDKSSLAVKELKLVGTYPRHTTFLEAQVTTSNELGILLCSGGKSDRKIHVQILDKELKSVLQSNIPVVSSKHEMKVNDLKINDDHVAIVVHDDNYGIIQNSYFHYLSRNDKSVKSEEFSREKSNSSFDAAAHIVDNKIYVFEYLRNKNSNGQFTSRLFDPQNKKFSSKQAKEIEMKSKSGTSNLEVLKSFVGEDGNLFVIGEDRPSAGTGTPPAMNKAWRLVGSPNKWFHVRHGDLGTYGEIASDGIYITKINTSGTVEWMKNFNTYKKEGRYDRLLISNQTKETVQVVYYTSQETVNVASIKKSDGSLEEKIVYKESDIIKSKMGDFGHPFQMPSGKWMIPSNNILKNFGVLSVTF